MWLQVVRGGEAEGAAVIVVLVPVLGRPHRAGPLAESLAAAPSVPHRLIWIVSPGDTAQLAACESAGGEVLMATWEPARGDFARKVNLAAGRTDEPWIFQAADDVCFEPGWDEALLETAGRTGAKVVGSNDCANPTVKAGKHATHILFERGYVTHPGASLDGPGTVFSTAYGHQWCDTEVVELAKRRGVWAFAADSHVVHEHPFWTGVRPLDATYTKGLASSREDARLYRQRLRRFPRAGV